MENGMVGACSTHERDEKRVRILDLLKGRNHMEEFGVEMIIILN
jgi:hypothetical protein